MRMPSLCFLKKYQDVLPLLLFIATGFCACSSSQPMEMEYVETPDVEDPFDNGYVGRLSFQGDTMRVLILGNSFSSDATAYLNEIVNEAGLNPKTFCIYNGVISGGGINEWIQSFEEDTPRPFYRMAGAMEMDVSGNLRDILGQQWDVCVFLQYSDVSYRWDSFETQLPKLVEIVKDNCHNPQLSLAYMMPWTHTAETTRHEWNGNISCARKIAKEYGITVFPVGTAIQNARYQKLDNGLYLTRDNWHLCHGVGRFVAACTLYESLLSSFAKRNILDIPVVHQLTEEEGKAVGTMVVDSTNASICKRCAFGAVEKPFAVTRDIASY